MYSEASDSCSSAAEDEFEEKDINTMLYPMFDVQAGLMPILLEESDESSSNKSFSIKNEHLEYTKIPPENRTDTFLVRQNNLDNQSESTLPK